ncbi:MAG: LLM class flavin-dependent oxidoreductase [Actinomycetota bacterium]|nr:LLM class flavin-dependent oxidoreductase [Actinomycetota bacterium]
MRVRIGIGVGTAAASPAELDEVVEGIRAAAFDSLWLSEVLTAPGFDPLAALAYVAGRFPGTKVGATALLPGRNLVRLAKQLATVDQLSGGRLLVALVPGLATGGERRAVGVPVPRRGDAIDAALPALRRMLAGGPLEGPASTDDIGDGALAPLPVQQPLDLWLGGMAPASLERCGRLADGWLPSRCTPEAAAAGRAVVVAAAARAGRVIDPEHFGASIAYARRRPTAGTGSATANGEAAVPVGLGALRARILAFTEAGFSKFVIRPLDPPASWRAELAELAEAVADLQR